MAAARANQWRGSIIASSWLLYFVFQAAVCVVAVRLASIVLLYGWDVTSVIDGNLFMIANRQMTIGSACAGFGLLLAMLTIGAWATPRVKHAAALLLLPAAIVVQAARIVYTALV